MNPEWLFFAGGNPSRFAKIEYDYSTTREIDYTSTVPFVVSKEGNVHGQRWIWSLEQIKFQMSDFQCCSKSKSAGKSPMDDMSKALYSERSKNMELESLVRRLRQQLTEMRLRQSR